MSSPCLGPCLILKVFEWAGWGRPAAQPFSLLSDTVIATLSFHIVVCSGIKCSELVVPGPLLLATCKLIWGMPVHTLVCKHFPALLGFFLCVCYWWVRYLKSFSPIALYSFPLLSHFQKFLVWADFLLRNGVERKILGVCVIQDLKCNMKYNKILFFGPLSPFLLKK